MSSITPSTINNTHDAPMHSDRLVREFVALLATEEHALVPSADEHDLIGPRRPWRAMAFLTMVLAKRSALSSSNVRTGQRRLD
jgi:hypothetical protein